MNLVERFKEIMGGMFIDRVPELIDAVKERDQEVLGKEENELQDKERTLYFVGKNDKFREIKKKMKKSLYGKTI